MPPRGGNQRAKNVDYDEDDLYDDEDDYYDEDGEDGEGGEGGAGDDGIIIYRSLKDKN